ncbi:hypothetical protein DR089_03560 [Mycoplasma hyorhinis]|uniref:Uncharacterized protein n=2 Tax=Mesomycoplasma hyorhinis TaxID=2100 RepID=A0ABD6IET4_MESHY|nr:hypothetical protein MOS_155 [Mesomycoplasma hyorhinis SK76]MXR08292.1 hypothetical protein [Mesomycoplasma hyorhinis]MXR09758.1 hypothetical protein [Mesomycoplasma hyorhinis]MXR11855.1 hypothetical protein [Mesomycoplasma hyorhinis]MXR39056.1 hypothetical protein [Mesomycoplasma hyorhinis]
MSEESTLSLLANLLDLILFIALKSHAIVKALIDGIENIKPKIFIEYKFIFFLFFKLISLYSFYKLS